MPRMRRRALFVLVLATIGPVACGGGGDGGPAEVGTATTQQEELAQQSAEEQERERVRERQQKRRAAQAARKRRLVKRYRRALKVALLPQEGKSRKEQFRIANAVDELAQIAKDDVDVVAPLTRALKQRDYGRITKLQFFYIRLGKPGSERVLIETLNRAGPTPTGTQLALTYLQSGNKKLTRAARQWASRQGFTITGNPTPTAGGGWGCLGVYDGDRRGGAPSTLLTC